MIQKFRFWLAWMLVPRKYRVAIGIALEVVRREMEAERIYQNPDELAAYLIKENERGKEHFH